MTSRVGVRASIRLLTFHVASRVAGITVFWTIVRPSNTCFIPFLPTSPILIRSRDASGRKARGFVRGDTPQLE